MGKPVPGPKSRYVAVLCGLPLLNILPSYLRIEYPKLKMLGKQNIIILTCHLSGINFVQDTLFYVT